jgi:phenylacetate-CoA ligase
VALATEPTGRTEPFDRLDRLCGAELGRWWRRRLRRVLETAYVELPFYRRRFEAAGFDPRSFRRLEDHLRVPAFTKADLLEAQRASSQLGVGIERAADDPGTVLAATSGTWGTSLFALPPRWRREQGRSSLRAHWWAGLRPGTPFLLSAPAWHTYAVVQSWWTGRLGLPCVVVAGTYLPRFAPRIVAAFRSFRPRFATLFLPMVFSLLAEARRQGLAPHEPFASLETLIVTGAPMTPGMRAHLERETGIARVVELAGSSENLLAVECTERAGLHVVPDTCYAEVIDPATGQAAAPRERGQVVHSALVPWGSLYLRYDGGDVGTLDPDPCPCGLPSPRIKLLGRAEDGFLLGGRALLPWDVQLALEEEVPELAGVSFALLREALDAGRLALVLPETKPEGGAIGPLRTEIEDRLRTRFGVRTEARIARHLPLLFKGVAPVIREAEAG